jgi:hypothetical protein
MGKDSQQGRPEQLLTRYFIYTTTDDGESLHLIGEQLATGSDVALRKHFAEPPTGAAEGHYVAISENSRRIRIVTATVKTSIADVKTEPPDTRAESTVTQREPAPLPL